MRIALVTPWENAWIPYYRAAVEKRGHEFLLRKNTDGLEADAVLHGWATPDSRPVMGARNIMFMRRYELWSGECQKVDWTKIAALVCVNTKLAELARRFVRIPVHVIYNGTDPARWTFRKRKPNTNIGMACHVHPKKNLPLAAQILGALPEGYALHIAGAVQDPCTHFYLDQVARKMRRRIYMYGHVNDLNLWWEQMGFCLSTSISEGNPNNVIEAMAKGIKPIVHDWPGAEEQFPERFCSVSEAVGMIQSGGYDSESYRNTVIERFSLSNFDRVLDLAIQPPMQVGYP